MHIICSYDRSVIQFIEDNGYKIVQKIYIFETFNCTDEFISLLKLKFGDHIKTYNEICNSAELSYYYARDVIKGRFIDGEAAIAKNAFFSAYYALDIINERFMLGEELIFESVSYQCIVYKQRFNL